MKLQQPGIRGGQPVQGFRNFRFFFTLLSVVTALLFVSMPAAKGQNPFEGRTPSSPDTTIANGEPPLTESMVDLYVNFDLWVLEIPYSAQARLLARAMLLEDWKNPADIQKDMATISLAAQVLQQTPENREFTRCDIQPMALGGMRADKRPYAQWVVAAYEQAQRPIAPGNPPLTESMVSRFTAFQGWLLEVPVTQSWKANMRAMLIDDWKKPEEIKNDLVWLDRQIDSARHTAEERDYMRAQNQPGLINAMRGDKGHPYTLWMLAAYDAAHPTIAAGNPPLNRQAVDAYTERYCFVQKEAGGAHLDCNQALKDSYAEAFAKTYPGLSSEEQKKLAQAPQTWAGTRLYWATASEADRQKLRARWQQDMRANGQFDADTSAVIARHYEFLKRDPNTVSERELLEAAQDCDIVAQQCRREQHPDRAATWDRAASHLRGGKAAYVQYAANEELAKRELMQIMLRHQQENSARLADSLNNLNSGLPSFHYEDRGGHQVRVDDR
jgi:hypothetical protein